MKHIYFTGMMGSGKSTIGELFAKKMQIPFIDLDITIEQKNKSSVSQIFSSYGETAFRDMETQELQEISGISHKCVIATGGGIIEREENRLLMRKTGVVIYLQVEVSTLVQRLINIQNRPLLQELSPEKRYQKLQDVFEKRKRYYESCDIVIVSEKTVEATILKIEQELQKNEYNKN